MFGAGHLAAAVAQRQLVAETVAQPFGDLGFWSRLSRLRQPSLFVWGERDRLVPSGISRYVRKALPGARQVILEDCGHVPQFEHPEVTHSLVMEFLAERAEQPRARESIRV